MANGSPSTDRELVIMLVEQIRQHREALERMERTMERNFKEIKEEYVTRAEFDPIQKLVYGVIASVLITVLGAVLVLVLR